MAQKRSTSNLWFCKNSIKPPRGGGGGGTGIPGNSWWGRAARFSKSWLQFRPKYVIFYTRFQTRPLKSVLVFRPAIYFLKAILNSCIFSFGIETTNIYIHALPYLENHTRFQTKMGRMCGTKFYTKLYTWLELNTIRTGEKFDFGLTTARWEMQNKGLKHFCISSSESFLTTLPSSISSSISSICLHPLLVFAESLLCLPKGSCMIIVW